MNHKFVTTCVIIRLSVELGKKCVFFVSPYSFILLMAMFNKKDLGLGKMASPK
jgi:hypothetical protein